MAMCLNRGDSRGMGKVTDLVIREIVSRKEVHRVHLANVSERHVEKTMRGILRQMDTDRFFVDDSEADIAREAERTGET